MYDTREFPESRLNAAHFLAGQSGFVSRKFKKLPENSPIAINPPAFDVLALLARYSTVGFVALLLLATVRIVITYDVFNHTIDEPAHIAAGMEWLDKHAYTYETQHPPLARVASAIGPYLDGGHTSGRTGIYYEGAAILYGPGHYDRTLTLARLGILPFFWIAAIVVYLWSRRTLGAGIALLAALAFTGMPAILGHAGVATTDMALTAFLLATMFAAAIWAESPTIVHSLFFGLAGGLAVLSKFSALPFFGLAAIIAILWWWFQKRPTVSELTTIAAKRALPLLIAALICAIVIWSGYRFSFANGRPAPEFFDGIHSVSEHNRAGHISYLLGETSDVGFWYYYPVALIFKTPLGLLLLSLVGFVLFWREGRTNAGLRIAASLAAALLLIGMWSSINIGTRHILPIFAVIAIFAAWTLARALESRTPWIKWTAIVLFAWAILAPAIQHPDYLAYFNELALGKPEKILVDSDLDWGQDMKRLSAKLHEVGAQTVTFNPFIIAYLEKVHGFPPIQQSDPIYPSAGWNAVSTTVLKLNRLGLDPKDKARPWPETVPNQQRVGKGILLYYFQPRP